MPSNKRKNSKVSVTLLDDASTDCVIQMLHGESNLYWHYRIRYLFAVAGLITRRIEREEAHPIWKGWLTRTSFDLDGDNVTAGKQLRKVLVKGGLEVQCGEFTLLDRRGDQLRIVFMLDLGAPGVLQRRPARGIQGELWDELQ